MNPGPHGPEPCWLCVLGCPGGSAHARLNSNCRGLVSARALPEPPGAENLCTGCAPAQSLTKPRLDPQDVHVNPGQATDDLACRVARHPSVPPSVPTMTRVVPAISHGRIGPNLAAGTPPQAVFFIVGARLGCNPKIRSGIRAHARPFTDGARGIGECGGSTAQAPHRAPDVAALSRGPRQPRQSSCQRWSGSVVTNHRRFGPAMTLR